MEGCETGVLLGLDTSIFDYCMELALEQKKQRHMFVKVTRCESKKQKELEKQEDRIMRGMLQSLEQLRRLWI